MIRQFEHNSYEPYNFIEISRTNLLHNLRFFQQQNPNQLVIPVVKSNAYGHGLIEVVSILNKAGVELVAVDGYFEASTVLEISDCNVLVMGAIRPNNVHLVNTKRCSFVVQDIQGLQAFASLNKPVRIHLELNTGMNRLGLSEQELVPYLKLLDKYPKLQLEGVMSHLADADAANSDFTAMQELLFEKLLKKITVAHSPKFIHLAQTAGSTKVNNQHANAIRLGIGLYGINPLQTGDRQFKLLQSLKPVLSLKSTVIKVQQLHKGDKVSYNGIFIAPRAMQIGILPLGYYEGYPRVLSNVGIATFEDRELPVVGRICMNHTMVDLSGSLATTGSTITLIDQRRDAINSVANICDKYALFPYQLVTGLNESVRRVVV